MCMLVTAHITFVVQPISKPAWVSLVKTKTGINNHCNPKSNKENKSSDISTFSIMLNDSTTHLSNSIT
ncbi:hypothetical protein MtrunA17_Chr8g0359951 [Medicago truncatula]|uniref:Uncharacterized protein n=1 Tax=Medicago truncatula TaxID=3880 RepID=A0A396GQD3_MEDTR|nr:hypothetical protein MtrunA17_Chr8g0359951 [Medicago truncatula]